MKVLFYSAKKFEIPYFDVANHTHIDLIYTEERLSMKTVNLARGYEYISVFTADDVSADIVKQLHLSGVTHIAVRAAGFDNVDLKIANELGIHVANVPEYSPYSVAEHAITLMLALNRKVVTANEQVHQHNFKLDNLVGFDLYGKTAGIIGTGRIGKIASKILHGFGCKLLGYDIDPDRKLKEEYNLRYCSLHELCVYSDIITIHTPLNHNTKYLIDRKLFAGMKKGVMIINTSRGAVVKTEDLITFLENGIIGAYGMDVYEHEKGIFFYDHSAGRLHDTMLLKLMSMKNVLVTPHQAFATYEALTNIAETTFYNLLEWNAGLRTENELTNFPRSFLLPVIKCKKAEGKPN
jgi:D-lactate dehydrogenase